MSDLILREFNGHQIRQREDGYFNLTDMAKANGKLFKDWNILSSTKDLISVISHKEGIPPDILITSKRYYGTYAHKKIAIAFATWCSPEFFAVVIDWTDEIMTKGGYISPDATSEQLEELKAEIVEKEEQIAELERQKRGLERNLKTSESQRKILNSEHAAMKLDKIIPYGCTIRKGIKNLANNSFPLEPDYEAEIFISERIKDFFGNNYPVDQKITTVADRRKFMKYASEYLSVTIGESVSDSFNAHFGLSCN